MQQRFFFIINVSFIFCVSVLDAFGKPGSGLMDYQVKWYGSYDECIAVKALDQYNTSEGKVTTQEHFAGKYCRVYIKAGQQSTVCIYSQYRKL